MVILFIYGALGEQSVLLLGKCLCICHLLFFFKLPTYEATPPGFYWTPPRKVGWLHRSITDSQTSLSSILLLAYSLQLFANQKQLINDFYKVLYLSEGVSAVGVIIIIVINKSQASLVNLFLISKFSWEKWVIQMMIHTWYHDIYRVWPMYLGFFLTIPINEFSKLISSVISAFSFFVLV